MISIIGSKFRVSASPATVVRQFKGRRRMQLSLGALCALVLCAGVVGQAKAWTVENSTNRAGGDYRNFEIVPLQNSIAGDLVAKRCEEACQKDSRCKAWTAVRPGLQSKNGMCWLKDRVPAARADACCTSGANIKVIKSSGKLPVTTGGAAPAAWTDMLKAHNDKRKLHCVPALKWSADLAAKAQAWANKCTNAHEGGGGENLAFFFPAGQSNATAFQNSWYCEVQWYDFNNPKLVGGFKKGCDAPVNGHFTQVVWKGTTQLGCGKQTCTMNGQTGTYWVCKYAPGGNRSDTDSLKQNVLAPKC
jgi:uncharacterized protein YkwD